MSGFGAPNVKVPVAFVVAGAVVVTGAAAVWAPAVVATLNCKMLCVAGVGTAGEPVPVAEGVDKVPKRDLEAGCGAT